ncbi:MAG: transporter substrate-binding domain-containing protein [Chitinispirillia bacterium]|nr:transporter substrate-binding domain-containing protein [Chitinispirillia bacterium]
MEIVGKLTKLIHPVMALSIVFSGCGAPKSNPSDEITVFSSYRDIPGVTEEEIAAIENIREETGSFTYGMMPSTETFIDANGEIKGYTHLFCEWMTELFGIPFIPKHYTWAALLDGLESGEIDFTGDLAANDELRKTYIMTEPIAQRAIKQYRIAGSAPVQEIAKTRLPRYALRENTAIADNVLAYAAEAFEPVYAPGYEEAYELLKSGKADVIITEGVHELFFERYGNMVTENFHPLIYSPVSFTARNTKFLPFISVVQKALNARAMRHLNQLYEDGRNEYMTYKLSAMLTEEEIEYIRQNPIIPFAAEYDNYPVSFYSVNHNEWRGISFDILKQVEMFTGLNFTVANDTRTGFHELLQMLERGDTYMISELIRTRDREGRFLWPNSSLMMARSVLISKSGHPDITINKVYSERIGLCKGTAHTEFFMRWFPNHPNTVIYNTQKAALDALIDGEVDMLMNSYNTLLYLTNYLELAGFKVNLMFDHNFESTFGINKDQRVLHSIINKALGLIDIKTVSERWQYRAYDYRLKIAQAKMPWLIGSVVLSLCVLTLVTVLFVISHSAGKQLEKKQTHEIALQTATLSTLFDSIPDLIFTKDAELNFMHCNKAFLEHFGRGMEDVIGKNNTESLGLSADMAERFNEKHREVMREGCRITFEERIPHINGTTPLYETTQIPLMLNGKPVGVVGIAHDITKRKEQAETALAASRSKSTFLANMSHEIRTPMNAILGVTEIMTQYDGLPKDIQEGLDKIYTSCTLLLGIIDDILDFSKIEAGKLDIMPIEYKSANLINDAVQLNMIQIDNEPINFELEVDEHIPAKLIGDVLRIKQILNNLLSNAFKYTDSGTITLSVTAESVPDKENSIIFILSVRDTGHGMTKEQLSKMFDEYSRFNQKAGRAVNGTGLGLAITQRLVTLMGGEIHVESKLGKGTLFAVRLPQTTVDSEILGGEVADNLRQFRINYSTSQNRSHQLVRDPMPYGSVLIVDDVDTNLYVAVGLMKLYRLQIDTAMSGREAIDKIKGGKVYDIVFMDHMMPEMDGIMTTKFLRKLGYTHPIVALTANAVTGQADIFLQNGFDEFISKPIDIRQMDSILNKLVRDKQPPDVIEAARRQTSRHKSAGTKFQTDPDLKESDIRDGDKAVSRFQNKRVDGLNIAKGLELYEGDDETYLRVLRTYAAAVRDRLAALETAGREKLSEYERAAHSIKGASFGVFAEQLGESAAQLENAAKTGDFGYIDKHNEKFLDITREFIADLDKMIAAVDAENPKPQKERVDTETLVQLRAACEAYNMDGADAAMEEIEKYQYTSDGGLAAWLRECMDKMGFAQIVDKLKDV